MSIKKDFRNFKNQFFKPDPRPESNEFSYVDEDTQYQQKFLSGSVSAGWWCIAITMFVLPIFAIPSFIIGLSNAIKGYAGHGIIQMLMSIFAAAFGAAMWSVFYMG